MDGMAERWSTGVAMIGHTSGTILHGSLTPRLHLLPDCLYRPPALHCAPAMKVLVTGTSGLIGSALVRQLTGGGHYVVRLVRGNPDRSRGDIVWDPVTGRVERPPLERMDAVVHLAGENLLGLWTPGKKKRIHRSRVQATEFLMEALAGLMHKPRVIVSASAVGYYGDRGAAWVDESSAPGDGFLPLLCREWEKATELAANAGIRVVNLRTGIVLSPAGGALQSMIPIFKAGLGGRLGSGRQYMSWIAIDDVVSAIQFALEHASLTGPVNAVAPEPVTNAEFTQALARALRRPAFLPVPALVLRLLPGGMGREAFLAGQRVEPLKLRRAGFAFAHPKLDEAIAHALGDEV